MEHGSKAGTRTVGAKSEATQQLHNEMHRNEEQRPVSTERHAQLAGQSETTHPPHSGH